MAKHNTHTYTCEIVVTFTDEDVRNKYGLTNIDRIDMDEYALELIDKTKATQGYITDENGREAD
jgi:hypothetical protein